MSLHHVSHISYRQKWSWTRCIATSALVGWSPKQSHALLYMIWEISNCDCDSPKLVKMLIVTRCLGWKSTTLSILLYIYLERSNFEHFSHISMVSLEDQLLNKKNTPKLVKRLVYLEIKLHERLIPILCFCSTSVLT